MLTRSCRSRRQAMTVACGGWLAAHHMLRTLPLFSDALATHISALPAKQSQEFSAALKSAAHMLT